MTKEEMLMKALHSFMQEVLHIASLPDETHPRGQLATAMAMHPRATQSLTNTMLTAKEAMDYLKIGRTTFYRLLQEQQLAPVQLRKRNFYRLADLQAVYYERRRDPRDRLLLNK